MSPDVCSSQLWNDGHGTCPWDHRRTAKKERRRGRKEAREVDDSMLPSPVAADNSENKTEGGNGN